jgi:F-type H+-transporting ATPase subunit b
MNPLKTPHRSHLTAYLIGAALLAPGLAAAASGGDEPGIINLNVTLLMQVVNFLILIALLSRFVWKPLTQFLGQRAEGIQKALTESQAAREAAAKAHEEYKTRISATQREMAAIREQAQREVEAERQRLLQASREEAQRLLGEAKASIEAETKRAQVQLRAEAAMLSLAAAERVLGRAITAEDQKRLAEQYVRELGGAN